MAQLIQHWWLYTCLFYLSHKFLSIAIITGKKQYHRSSAKRHHLKIKFPPSLIVTLENTSVF